MRTGGTQTEYDAQVTPAVPSRAPGEASPTSPFREAWEVCHWGYPLLEELGGAGLASAAPLRRVPEHGAGYGLPRAVLRRLRVHRGLSRSSPRPQWARPDVS
ncbi:hypothetical protein GCM10009801_01310 [Streptomyces albiaxialis]|uniref:Uncharacterized protein n=1 Tax=Streptomyces albiaxialis TaxID=329523 RepID=A0ABN2VE75_9ACTN